MGIIGEDHYRPTNMTPAVAPGRVVQIVERSYQLKIGLLPIATRFLVIHC